ncbi:MAG: ABC transporter permease [Oscillospiraceae bacterium]
MANTTSTYTRSFTSKKEFFKQFKKKSRLQEIWQRFLKNKTAVIGMVLFLLVILVAIAAPFIADYDTEAIKVNVPQRLQPPGTDGHLLGTDEMGRDILARIVHGARISLVVGFLSVGVALLIGGALGAIAGFYGGRIDNIIMRAMDVFLCLPDVLLALAIVATFGTSQLNMTIAIGLSFTPKFSRVVRAAVMSVRGIEYVEAARAIGATNAQIIGKHILINCIGPIIVQVTLYVANAILTISSLSFIGLGIQAPTPEWGNMLASGRANAYIVLAPGLAIFITILSLNLLGDGLRDALDPRLKQ